MDYKRTIKNIFGAIAEDIKRSLRVGYDLDDVIADLDMMVRQRLGVILGRYLPKEARTCHYFSDVPGLPEKLGLTPEELRSLVIDCYNEIDYKDLPVSTSAVKMINKLKNDGHQVYIITARNANLKDVTARWLDDMGITNVPVYFGDDGLGSDDNSKANISKRLHLDYFIDDKLSNLRQFDDIGQVSRTIPIAFDQPWNQSYMGPRLFRHSELYELLDDLESR